MVVSVTTQPPGVTGSVLAADGAGLVAMLRANRMAFDLVTNKNLFRF